jgi:hypothetical protein
MRSRFSRFRLSPAFPISLMALFVALGGIGYAAATVGTGDIKNSAVTSKKIKNGTIKKKDLKFTIPTGGGAQGPVGPQGPPGPAGSGQGFSFVILGTAQQDVVAGGYTLRQEATSNSCGDTRLIGKPAPTNSQWQEFAFRFASWNSSDLVNSTDNPNGSTVNNSEPDIHKIIVRDNDGSGGAEFQYTLDTENGCHFAGTAVPL